RFCASTVKECFAIMEAQNRGSGITRIENLEAEEIKDFRALGLKTVFKLKDEDYVYLTRDLAELKGNRYKSKRAAVNYFQRNYAFKYLPFKSADRKECLVLFQNWQAERREHCKEPVYQSMLSDSLAVQKMAMENYRALNLQGRIIRVDGRIKAYTFGFELQKDTFCVLFEVSDLKIKGAANFIFQQFCQEMVKYRYTNCMDASGLENLKRVKLSFRPCRKIPAYIATNE
ncbi:MAG: phosphatidylglycerol lysyltransferase domain-containing protein, partial [Candidatus Omnitrophota bacterium]